jgi:nicotinamide-nucleotide adenylyltransferase/phosphinothricin biosynthesis protein PhpF
MVRERNWSPVPQGEAAMSRCARHDVAVIHGRFQPLHIGHMEYLLAGKSRCDLLVVGITNPDPWQIGVEKSDPARGQAQANPFTYYERYCMVEGALLDSGVQHREMRIVPFPHSYPERLKYYAPRDAVYLLSIYNEWGDVKVQRFEDLGLQTEILWRRNETVTSGTAIRQRIRGGLVWEHLVPEATARVIRQCPADHDLYRPASDSRATAE